MTDSIQLGIALSGGGARGAYEVGVWKAIIELGLSKHISAIAGTSIGAINAAIILQDEFEELHQLWESLHPSRVLAALPEDVSFEQVNFNTYLTLFKDAIKKGRVDITPMKELLYQKIKPAKIKASPIDFYLNAWNVKQFKGEQYLAADLEDNQLIDYIIASASFPLFLPHKIKDQYFLDGGIDLNLPLDLPFRNSKVKHVIAVDVATFMRYRPKQLFKEWSYRNKITFVRPSKFIASPINFSNKAIKTQLKLGYEDGLSILTKIKEEYYSRVIS